MKKKLLVIFFLFLGADRLFAETKNSIIITVGNYPVTRLDLIKEVKLITVLSRISINQNNRKEIQDLAVQALVKRAIKESEIDRLKITRYSKDDLNNQISIAAKNLGLDKEGFKIFLEQNNLKIEDLIRNLEIDFKWNTAIYELYKNKVSLNTIEIENKIKSELEKTKSGKSLLLSEIQVNLSTDGLEATSNKIFLQIKELGFENVARKLSISSTAANGGSLGWVKESKLSKNIYENIKNLKNGEVSRPIPLGDTVIFIKKINEKDNPRDLETIKKNIVHQEKLKKLEMFSNSHYSDLERKTRVKFL